MTAPGITSTPAPSPAEGETIDRGLTADTIVAPAARAVALTARRVRLSPMATKTSLPLAAAEANQSSVRPTTLQSNALDVGAGAAVGTDTSGESEARRRQHFGTDQGVPARADHRHRGRWP